MEDWSETKVQNIFNELQNKKHRHVAFVIGSAVSIGYPSNCLSVTDIQRAILLSVSSVIKKDLNLSAKIAEYLDCISKSYDSANLSDVGRAIHDLPFEHFMACLYNADKDSTEQIIKTAYDGQKQPNNNHWALVNLVKILLSYTSIERISILTTNYDRCIDIALEKMFGSTLQLVYDIPVPAFQLESPEGKIIRYVKLHGCVDIQGSQVYTIDKMGQLILSLDWTQCIYDWLMSNQSKISVAIFTGYGFWDPDLYGLFEMLTDNVILIRNERPGFSMSNSLHGRDVLQSDAFSRMQNNDKKMCYTTLLKDEIKPYLPSIFIDLARSFSNNSVKLKVPSKPDEKQIEIIHDSISKVLSSLTEESSLVFWGHLLNVCERYEGRDLFKSTLQDSSRVKIRNEMAIAYLHMFGNKNDWHGAIEACNKLIQDSNPTELRIIGYAYRSFMLTISDKKNLLQAIKDLRNGKKLLKGVSKLIFRYYQIYNIHLWAKIIEVGYQRSNGWGRMLGIHFILRIWAWQLASRIEKIISDLKDFGDAVAIGNTLELFTEMLIIAGKLEKAENFGKQTQVWRSFIGGMSKALQSDRLLGWICLAYGSEEQNREAITCFARGLERALNVPEQSSLVKKLGANLIRVFWSNDLDVLKGLKGHIHKTERIKEACRSIQASGAINELDAKDITEYVLDLFGEKEQELKNEIMKLKNLKHYPIFLPTCE